MTSVVIPAYLLEKLIEVADARTDFFGTLEASREARHTHAVSADIEAAASLITTTFSAVFAAAAFIGEVGAPDAAAALKASTALSGWASARMC